MSAGAEKIRWTFYGYVTKSGTREVEEWLLSLDQSDRDEAVDTILYLSNLQPAAWGQPPFKPLGDGLSEIRFKGGQSKKTFRIYGGYWPNRRFSYTMLLGTEKKVKNPRADIAQARVRLKEVTKGANQIHEFRF